MRVLIDALSATNLSARYVLLGHLTQLAKWTVGKHDYVVLYHRLNKDMRCDLGSNIKWLLCPDYTAHCFGRFWWEKILLPRFITKFNIDFLFNPSGMIVSSLRVPQVVYAMNPWALVSTFKKTPFEEIKAEFQRRAYRKAMAKSEMMIFLSEYIRGAYRDNAGFSEKESEIVRPGLDEETYSVAKQMCNSIKRLPFQILCVSFMAPHKDIETLLKAVRRVNLNYKIPAQLYLVGPWGDKSYERIIRNMIEEQGITNRVFITGRVSRKQLLSYYAESKVFCLMSRCESFGIPAVEAQSFGTPVVSSNCCAIPEACGKGGIYPEPGDIIGTSQALAKMLTDNKYWSEMSKTAIENASKYHWEICSRSLLRMFDVIEKTI